jgi:hypothetical protein
VASGEPIFDERQQDTILFIRAVEERADVTILAQLGAGEGNWGR